MADTDARCSNCQGTGWVGYEFPTSNDGGQTYVMRQRINPCHVCNAQGWKEWGTKIAESGRG